MGKVKELVIISGKGGTGKTTISTNLTSYLATMLKDVVLADLDVEEPNAALFVKGKLKKEQVSNKMIPKWSEVDCTLCGKCAEVCNFNAIVAMPKEIVVFPELCHSCYACSELCPTNSLPMTPSRIGVIKEFEADGFSLVEGRLDLGQEMAVPLIAQTIKYTDKNFSNSIIIKNISTKTIQSFSRINNYLSIRKGRNCIGEPIFLHNTQNIILF